ncbi:energy-coupling factor ABC transporter permease [Trichlorobacter ammonificans]|uniref:Cobalamin (Vitamin B12) biosynthesis CbiM protein n=1 Tax=Trichlorobacter ammonificans TaxID=2916410 RepID=A0ABM9D3W7_9BACT|nr:energy-coupling factor ABC transporter permease [Trichlorobacter ammonificans]CAH2029956.1 Cobalamin (Vitamin B12) biosynthesis CbiM protein [Trichlorobacter ammonificans]
MHMADALISPAVGGTMWAVSAAMIARCSSRIRTSGDDRTVPLMGVLGAFVFAAQMINFTIPLTGSSGHLGGGLLLAVLLGPAAAFLTIASVLVVQALFFADGGLLALGCNIFNLGFFPAFVAYPLLYRPLAGAVPSRIRLTGAAVVAAVAGLQLGAGAVVLQTTLSGISSLPFGPFLLLMQPIHLAIGVVEGLVTAAVLQFVRTARPELLGNATEPARSAGSLKPLLIAFVVATLLTGGLVSHFASEQPDGLEWSIAGVSGSEQLQGPEQGLHARLAALQEKIAPLPDYAFKKGGAAALPEARLGTSLSGIAGGVATLLLAMGAGFLVSRRKVPLKEPDALR